MIRTLTIDELNNDDLRTLHYRNVKFDELSKRDKCLYEINETLRYEWKHVNDEDYHFANNMYATKLSPRYTKTIGNLYKDQGIEIKYVGGGLLIKLITNRNIKKSKRFRIRTSMSNEVKSILSE